MARSRNNRIKFLILALFVIVVILVIKYTNIGASLSRESIVGKVDAYGPFAPLVFIFLYILATLFFLPGTPFSLAAGFLFGTAKGTVIVVIGATIGATGAFLFSHFLGEQFVERFLKDKFKKLYEYDKKIESAGLSVMLFLRLIPLFPFNGLNFAMGLTKMKWWQFVIGTFIGIIPGTFVYVNLGATGFNILSPTFYIAIALLAVLALLPAIYKWTKKKKWYEKIFSSNNT